MVRPEALLRAMFEAAVAAAQPDVCVPPALPAYPQKGRLLIIGAGKASAAMARAAERHYGRPLEGLIVTRYGHAVACDRIEIVEAAHPVPDEAGADAARRMLQLVGGLCADDTVLCLISGGGSSLLPLPLDGITLQDKQTVNRALLRCGATISEMNCVRRHLSAIKGGRLAAACHPARLINLLISDVPGDDPIDIASGPTVGDPTNRKDALEILRRYRLDLPQSVREVLDKEVSESVKPGDPRVANVETRFVATPQQSLEAAASIARDHGITPHILGDAIEGEAREVAVVMAGMTHQITKRDQPFERPCVLLSGGETTVTINGDGRGGRNVEFLLSLAVALKGADGVHAIAGDTDGVDGAEEVAGAVIRPDTLSRAQALGLSAGESLLNNDGHGFFEALNDQVITGATLTNVNDFRAILIDR
ncbi:glycerate kinase [Notoacmeibacter sp. MSK16QG-6]|uniref:glycerate kinase type-2 family protein n=1 Tax=Notoacmeibacter sp. MSK16QG-6 TaxID=2957982 RepID=UPI0020A024F8|nr:glycerate kinase [Notoacmeibacter sp. MSK16QG-6]MCP1199558.1 glycerate kinase [Notoacmeibacter sp. MSK16QG-6]